MKHTSTNKLENLTKWNSEGKHQQTSWAHICLQFNVNLENLVIKEKKEACEAWGQTTNTESERPLNSRKITQGKKKLGLKFAKCN